MMELKVISEFENPLLERKQIWIQLSYSGSTPSREQIRQEVCEFLKSDPKLTLVDKILTRYGSSSCKVYVKIYRDPQLMLRIERPQVLRRNKLS